MWRNASADTRAKFERMADEVKAEHKRKFPDYKFQPKKKEEKERLKEAQKQQRLAQKRDMRSRRGVERKSPAPPTLLQPSTHPYYTAPHFLYGPAGPSPPISAASSPSSLSDATSSPKPTMLQLTSTPLATPPPTLAPLQISSTLTLPIPSTPIEHLPFPLQLPTPSTPQASWSLAHQTSQTPISNDAPENDTTVGSVWDPSNVQLDQTSFLGSSAPVTFELPANIEAQTQNWTQLQDSQFMDPYAFLQSTTPGLYEIQSLDQSALSSDPSGEVEISVGNIHNSDDVSNFLGTTFFDRDASAGLMLGGMNADYTTSSESYDFTQFFNSFPFELNASLNQITPLDGPSGSIVESNVTAEQQPSIESIAEPSETVSNTYVPPSGAAYSSSRRVAGNWANSVFVNQPNDHSSQQELRAQ